MSTILIPGMMPLHFELLTAVFHRFGYPVEMCRNEGPGVLREGLAHVHNDTCYPAILVIGQMLDALENGGYDREHTALMITQTGGGCRASNYIHLLRKALKQKGLTDVPVYSFNLSGLERGSGFQLTLPMLRQMISAMVVADALMFAANQVRPYEATPGDCDRLLRRKIAELQARYEGERVYSRASIREMVAGIVADFAALPVVERQCVRVGIVGEIYVKYAYLGNNHLEDYLAKQGCEVMLGGLLGFLMFKTDNRLEDIRLYGGSRAKKRLVEYLLGYLTSIEAILVTEFGRSRFRPPATYAHLKELARGVIGSGCKMGEGWLLTAEALDLIEQGHPNIVCAQPFGCLPNHIVAKGMVRAIKERCPQANITSVDYDPGATRVNQENRIKLMLAVAAENMRDGATTA